MALKETSRLVARRWRWAVGLCCGLSLLLAACGAGTPAPAATSAPADNGADVAATDGPADTGGDGEVAADPTATAASGVPEGVPVLANATDLNVTTDGSYIAYKAAETYDNAVAFYQTELAAQGWVQINKNDAAFGGSTTLLRQRPDANISVTIQAVAGDDNAVRVLISISKR